MKLTKAEIECVADRLDNIIGDHFHDAIWGVLNERNSFIELFSYEEVSDEDIQRIKDELKKHL